MVFNCSSRVFIDAVVIRHVQSRGGLLPMSRCNNRAIPQSISGASGGCISLTKATELMRLQDAIIAQDPAVQSVVGKIGRAETSTDPAPINMGETIVTFVRLGTKVPWFEGFFVNAAASVAAAAASMGVTAVAPQEMRPVSPQK